MAGLRGAPRKRSGGATASPCPGRRSLSDAREPTGRSRPGPAAWRGGRRRCRGPRGRYAASPPAPRSWRWRDSAPRCRSGRRCARTAAPAPRRGRSGSSPPRTRERACRRPRRRRRRSPCPSLPRAQRRQQALRQPGGPAQLVAQAVLVGAAIQAPAARGSCRRSCGRAPGPPRRYRSRRVTSGIPRRDASTRCSYQALFCGPSDSIAALGSPRPSGAAARIASASSSKPCSSANARGGGRERQRGVNRAASRGPIGKSRGRARVVLEHLQPAVRPANQVEAHDRRVAAGHLDPEHPWLEVVRAVDDSRRNAPRPHHLAFAVDVGDECVEGAGALCKPLSTRSHSEPSSTRGTGSTWNGTAPRRVPNVTPSALRC